MKAFLLDQETGRPTLTAIQMYLSDFQFKIDGFVKNSKNPLSLDGRGLGRMSIPEIQ